uniref:Uncharacterized protein n=1 Tax=Rhinolophus ferrumequinum TaxID=59479 RepID=A0A671DRK6_RHIFE
MAAAVQQYLAQLMNSSGSHKDLAGKYLQILGKAIPYIIRYTVHVFLIIEENSSKLHRSTMSSLTRQWCTKEKD